jgi:hypothetical protein
MLTRHEILKELLRLGIHEPLRMKKYLREFERYMATNHGSAAMNGEKQFHDYHDSDVKGAMIFCWKV